jgi:hypothetical protein
MFVCYDFPDVKIYNVLQRSTRKIEFVSDLRQVDGFLWALGFPPPIKLTTTI